MRRWLLKRKIRRDLVGNVRYVKILLRDADGAGKLYHVNGFDDEYLRFIDLEHFGQYAIKWTDINTNWHYFGVSNALWHHFEDLVSSRDMDCAMVLQAIGSLEGNRYRIPAYCDSNGVWFYITQSHNFQQTQGHFSVVLYRGEEDDGPGMRAVPYSSLKGGIKWEVGPRERQPHWGRGVHYNTPHHWFTVDALEAIDVGVLPAGDVLFETRRDGIVRYHVGRLTIHPELLPMSSVQPMSINLGAVSSQLQAQLRHHYVDTLTVLDFILPQESVYRDHYDKYVRDFMAGLLPGQRLTLTRGLALVAGDHPRMLRCIRANHQIVRLGLVHTHDLTGCLRRFNDNELCKLCHDLNLVLYRCGVKAENRFINFEVE